MAGLLKASRAVVWILVALAAGCGAPAGERYESSWNSLSAHSTPQWFKNAKFGIYTCWGVYSVPAYCTSYAGNMYEEQRDTYKHHVEHYGDPKYSGLYGPVHNQNPPPKDWWRDQDRPNDEFLDLWQGKVIEVIDKYQPDMLWFDFQLDLIPEGRLLETFAYYFNQADRLDKEVLVTYKRQDLAPGVGVHDLERKQMLERSNEVWLTDSSLNMKGSWGYVPNLDYQSVNTLVDNLVDRVSKNGCLLLNVGPKADGTIPEEARKRLLGLGEWLKLNGEAIYDTTVWMLYGEGPTKMKTSGKYGLEEPSRYTGQDIRFTAKGNVLYAICLDWPGEEVAIASLKRLYPSEISKIEMVGADGDLDWTFDRHKGLTIKTPAAKPCEHAYVFRITRHFEKFKRPSSLK